MAKVAIIGRGWGSRSQEPNFRAAGLEVIAVVGRDGWRAVLDSDADLVVVSMPPALHLEMATAVLEAGKHILCEKPTALNAAEAEQMLKAAESRPDRIAIIDHELRFVPAFRAARDRFADIGPIRYVEVRYSSPARGDRSRDWNWWSDASQGGGVLGAVGSHFTDTLRYFGCGVEAVSAHLKTVIGERSGKPVTADDWSMVHLQLRGGAIATFALSAVSAGPDESAVMTIHGENGAFRLIGEELLFAKPRTTFERIAGRDLEERPGNSKGGAFGTGTYQLGLALKRALDDGDRSALADAATFADGLVVQRVLDASRASNARGGGWVPV